MKFKYFTQNLGDFELFPILSLCIMFTFFCVVTYRAIKTSKERVKEMENMPLND